jgi:hypothetical protein
MISAEQNELMTRIGPGTPAGKLLRRYWQPVALVDEMKGERPVKAVRLFSRIWFCTRPKAVTVSCRGIARIAART